MNNRLSLTAIGALILAMGGCATTQDPSFVLNCTSTQSEQAVITYGPSELKVDKDVLEVEKDMYFKLYLNPRDGFENKNVTIAGVGADARWVMGRGNKSKGMNPIEICVPGNTFVDQKYKYVVVVQDVGMLDPRVKVIE